MAEFVAEVSKIVDGDTDLSEYRLNSLVLRSERGSIKPSADWKPCESFLNLIPGDWLLLRGGVDSDGQCREYTSRSDLFRSAE
jgi:hypothetical protein